MAKTQTHDNVPTEQHRMSADNQTCLRCGRVRCSVCGWLSYDLINGICEHCLPAQTTPTEEKNNG